MTKKSVNYEFKFRTKFNLLNDENRSSFIWAFNYFCNLDSTMAFKVLWKMTYSKDRALEEIYKMGLNYDLVPPEKVLIFRNELRYQYEECVQAGFLQFYKGDSEEIKEAFAKLKNRSDGIVASMICNTCISFVENSTKVERVLYLLNNEKEGFYFGGIRTLGFDVIEADYLKPFHYEIYNILKAINEYVPLDSEQEIEDEEEYIEEKNELEDIQEKIEEEVEVEENPIKQIEEVEQQYKKITPGEILKNKEIFKNFILSDDFNILIPIAKLGFDLNEVMRKKEEIFNFINIAEDLTN